jgi:hypothetical protein
MSVCLNWIKQADLPPPPSGEHWEAPSAMLEEMPDLQWCWVSVPDGQTYDDMMAGQLQDWPRRK